MNNPILPAFEFFLALYQNMPIPFRAFISLVFIFLLFTILFNLFFKIRS